MKYLFYSEEALMFLSFRLDQGKLNVQKKKKYAHIGIFSKHVIFYYMIIN